MTKKGTKTKAPKKQKPEQLKIEGTGRTDAIPELDRAGEAYRAVRDEWMELQESMGERQGELTDLLKKHKLTDYTYEGGDGKLYKATLAEAKAKVKRVKEPKAPKQS